MDNNLFEQAKNDDILSKELISFLLESMEYSRLSFISSILNEGIKSQMPFLWKLIL